MFSDGERGTTNVNIPSILLHFAVFHMYLVEASAPPEALVHIHR